MILRNHRDLTILYAWIDNRSVETVLTIKNLPYSSWTEVNECYSGKKQS